MALFLMTGCWDRIDIENRGYVIGVAIDKYPPIPRGQLGPKEETAPEEEESFIHMQLHTGEPAYAMTIQLPIIKKAGLLPMGESGEGGESSRTWELTQIGNSFIEMNREFSSRTNHIPFYGQLQVIVISEDVAREGLLKVLDFFDRDPEMRKRTKLYISKGEAKKILEINPRIEDYASIYLAKIPMNAKINAKNAHETDLGRTLSDIASGADFILSRVEATKDEIKDSGAAVFKGDKMVGWLSDIETESFKLLRNMYIGGVVTAWDKRSNDSICTLEITSAKTKIKPVVIDDKVSFNTEIKILGNYVESTLSRKRLHMDRDHLRAMEESFEDQIKRQCEATIKRVQKDYGADIFHFKKILMAKEPSYWEKISAQWDDIFPKVMVNINVSVRIEGIGNTR